MLLLLLIADTAVDQSFHLYKTQLFVWRSVDFCLW